MMFIRGWYNYMFRPVPAIIRFSSERVSVFTGSVRLCNDCEISSSVVLIITIIIKRIRRGRFCNVGVVLIGVYCSWQIDTYVSTKPPVSTTPTLQNLPLLIRFIIIVITKNHRWWDLTIVTQPHRSCKHWYSFGWKPDDGRNRPKHVVISSSNKHH